MKTETFSGIVVDGGFTRRDFQRLMKWLDIHTAGHGEIAVRARALKYDLNAFMAIVGEEPETDFVAVFADGA
jgi:hypothetical protein